MKKLEILQHEGKEIYFLDFSGMKNEAEIQALIAEGKRHIRSKNQQSVYSLTNIEEMHFNSEIKELFTEFIKGNKSFIKASAVLGVTGLRQIVFNGVMKLTGREIRLFDNADVAKKWLVSHS